jgi:hypothetical protein
MHRLKIEYVWFREGRVICSITGNTEGIDVCSGCEWYKSNTKEILICTHQVNFTTEELMYLESKTTEVTKELRFYELKIKVAYDNIKKLNKYIDIVKDEERAFAEKNKFAILPELRDVWKTYLFHKHGKKHPGSEQAYKIALLKQRQEEIKNDKKK